MNNTKKKKTNKTAEKKEKTKAKKTFSKPDFKALFKNKSFITILILLAAFGLGMLLRGTIVAATVNGTPITRLKIIKQLEETQGKATLEALINELLIQQELDKQNISVSQEDIDTEITKIKQSLTESGQDFDDLLEIQGITQESVEKDIRIQLGLEKLLADKVNVADEEVDQYIQQNSESFPEDLDTTTDEFKEQVIESLKQQKLSTEFTSWLENTKSKSDINYYIDY